MGRLNNCFIPMKIYLVCTGALVWLAACTAPSPADPCKEFDALDLKMLTLIEEIKAQENQSKQFISRLDNAQVYWIQYRDRHLRAMYPGSYDTYREQYGKEAFNACKCKEMSRMTRLRIEELSQWLKGNPASECLAN